MRLVGVDGSSNHITSRIGVGGRHPIFEKRGCIIMSVQDMVQDLNVTNATRLPTYGRDSACQGPEQRCWRSHWRHLEAK
jgi:hypothetical protein